MPYWGHPIHLLPFRKDPDAVNPLQTAGGTLLDPSDPVRMGPVCRDPGISWGPSLASRDLEPCSL